MINSYPDRRAFLATAGMASLGLSACRPSAVSGVDQELVTQKIRRLAPVLVSRARVIRTVVGLRPFRRTGFRLETVQLDSKRIVHNYGHGGGGVTLSWGCAHLAVEQAVLAGATEYAVIGCGALGLSTARLLQKRGHRVTIYARDLPPETTSNIAGAQWNPFTLSDRSHRTPEYSALQEKAARLSHHYFQNLPVARYGIRWLENYALSQTKNDRYLDDPINDLYADTQWFGPGEHPFDAPFARRYFTMLIEMPIYLDALMSDFAVAGGRVVIRDFGSVDEVLALPETVIINCTGLGSRQLFNDTDLLPIKGQLTVLLPQPEVDYIALLGPLYMFPRQDGILLGGTTERHVWNLDVNAEAEEQILAEHQQLFSKFDT